MRNNRTPSSTQQVNVRIPHGTDLNSLPVNNEEENSDNLSELLRIQQRIRMYKSAPIVFDKAVIFLGGIGIINPNTINVIEGPAGSHKSRLAETLCSIIIGKDTESKRYLGFTRNSDHKYSLLYVDTERNVKDQFPYALQNIQAGAGYKREEHLKDLDYLSLITIDRKERLAVIGEYVDRMRHIVKDHWVLVFDVCSDIITDFNKVDCSLQFTDWMNILITNYGITIICVIHENPGNNNKAKGHLGTELINKASTAIQIAGHDKLPPEIYRIKFLKCRSSKKPSPIFVRYDDDFKGLAAVPAEEVESQMKCTEIKAPLEKVADYLAGSLKDGPKSKTQLMSKLAPHFDAVPKTLEKRINDLIDGDIEITLEDGEKAKLVKATRGREVFYSLVNNSEQQKSEL